MDGEYDVEGGYLPSFVQHLKDTAARLGSRLGSQSSQDRSNTGDAAAEAHTLSTWTPAEYDAFFRAVSVHSRWRPDLIAACLPTRSEWEVWMYLEALEGAATLATQQDGEDVDMQVDGYSDDSQSHSGSDMDEDEDVCEPALEVTQAWIDAEECMASWIVDGERQASLGDSVVDDTEGMGDDRAEPRKRKRGRPRGTGKGRAQGRVRGQTVSDQGHSPPSVRRSPSPELMSTSARKREALMAHLEVSHLLVLDNILREGEEAVNNRGRDVSVPAVTPTDHGDEREPHAHEVEASGLPSRAIAPQGTGEASQSPSDVAIDPVLLALSGDIDATACQSGRVPGERVSTSRAPAPALAQSASSLPGASSRPTSTDVASQPGTGNMFVFPLGTTHSDPAGNVESDLSLFSPRSRRRIQKRLYMRRKRASEKGEASAGAVDTGIERLKPGKKAKSERSKTAAASASVPRSEVPSDAEVELEENVSKKCRGLTLPYKLKAQFAELDVDVAYLRSRGMDLLNMSALGRLMGLRSSLEHGEEVDETATTQSIDAELVRYLQTAMVSFVTEMIHRAIVWKEREIRLKQRSQAWRHGGQVTVNAVEHAVEAIGARFRSHKGYFKSLETISTELSAPATAPEKPNLANMSVDPLDLSLHRDVYSPLICPPSAWGVGPLACLTRTYEREASRTRRGRSAEMEEEDLMSDQTDEEALEAELEEEDEAEERDMELSHTHERDLWDAVGKSRLDIT